VVFPFSNVEKSSRGVPFQFICKCRNVEKSSRGVPFLFGVEDITKTR
jgi:hypothetical protein